MNAVVKPLEAGLVPMNEIVRYRPPLEKLPESIEMVCRGETATVVLMLT
jgi:hypothetical protein